MSRYDRWPSSAAFGGMLTMGLLVLLIFSAAMLYGCPQYNVYARRMAGEAALAQSEAEKQVRVSDANARLEAAQKLSQVEVELARGAAEANQLLIETLGGPENYLRWRYIVMLEKNAEEGNDVSVIYVPTEAQIPIMEARREPAAP